ncbi:hypothetical protein P618_200652 [Holospora obtusa F1]|uniref:NusB/RsmB/TIM44 domain-containing protein n=1 Tax=Holospora obtusa F1 TaxID=1399147 RepID=W6TGW1_HOLOB|nr:transcription antitermination factor NusB [Holospora obtusa]ETZ07170.1 hypothetical protein P618_200652 [Holospora obtusa F1]
MNLPSSFCPSLKKKEFSSRSVARALSIQCVFMLDYPEHNMEMFLFPIVKSRTHALFCDNETYSLDVEFAQSIIFGVKEHKIALQDSIQTGLLKLRTLSLLEEVTKSILLCGAWELKYALQNPIAVILYEYVQWAKHFLPEEGGYGFVHGVLDNIRPLLRSEI